MSGLDIITALVMATGWSLVYDLALDCRPRGMDKQWWEVICFTTIFVIPLTGLIIFLWFR